ncbi:MAG TPA: SUMF1/EgtB/PvdO family nonheme iron enzyme [Anaerolineales bacterium]|nr:SUMF1/EgtB/PvdO family nonheme iron enzyme [Anaerolineales bacterium]
MTTFISYSRVNSEFVVRLARDLKTAGFDVWLDQLDIPKGARWDDAIEAAVERSSTFMIVLAPESMESQNVKDELSYAIDSGKHILPVVIRPCKIPLRLRRFQYVDFTDKPYKDSLADIKHLLSITRQLGKPVEAEPHYEEPASAPLFEAPPIQREPAPQPESLKQGELETANPRRKFIAPMILAVVAVAGIVVAVVFAGNRTAPPPATFTLNPPTITSTSPSTPTPPPQLIMDDFGIPMRLVSAGDFIMGSDSGFEEEKPVQTVYLETFYIDKYEVTNALYRSCVEAGACQPPKKPSSIVRAAYYTESEFDTYPVVDVDWNMARTYCEWRGARLPTEAEWEKAARGTDGRTYPWGEDVSCNEANYFGCEGNTSPVSSYQSGISVYGVYNMAGNVYEWVSSLYMDYPYDPADGREDMNVAGERVIRGGSWLTSDGDNEVRSARRQKADPSTAGENIGFRCVSMAVIPETGTLPTVMTPLNSITATHIAATNRSNNTKEAERSGRTPTPTPVPTKQLTFGSLTPASPVATLTEVPQPTGTEPLPPTDTELPPDTPVPPPDTPVPPPDTPVQ